MKPAKSPFCSLADESFGLEIPGAQSQEYALFAPLHYEAGYAYPLIVWLHRQGCDEGQLREVMPAVSIRNYVAVAPRGVHLSSELDAFGWREDEAAIEEAQRRIFACIEIACRRFNVSPRRIFIGGAGTGGTMAIRTALARPDCFAGALSLCGAFPSGDRPLRNLARARKVPLFLAVSRHCQSYPEAAVCHDLRLLHSAGIYVTLRQYANKEKMLAWMLSDVDRWIIDQITSPGATPSFSPQPC